MKTNIRTILLVVTLGVGLINCGGDGQSPAPAASSASDSGEEATGVCAMLSREEVDTVVQGNDGGKEDQSLKSLYPDVDTGQCRYLHVEGMEFNFLVMTVYRASSDKGFERVDLSDRLLMASSSLRKLDIGDVSFLDDLGTNSIKVSFSKGKDVVELELNASDAEQKSEQLIQLARLVADQL